MLKKSALSVAFAAAFGVQANAALIDFTDVDAWADGVSAAVIDGITVTVSASGGSLTQTAFDAVGPVGPLEGESDGLGVNDDEISFGRGQSITVAFSSSVAITDLYFLDLFAARFIPTAEEAIATFSDGTVISTLGASASVIDPLGFVSSSEFGPIVADSIVFTAGPTDESSTGAGTPDFALAGIEFDTLAPIPLPASVWMLLASMVGVSFIARRRTA